MATRNAQLSKKIVYYFSNPTRGGTGEIMMGLPDQFAAPHGFEKIVCNTTHEAEKWSGRMRIWEDAKERIAEAYQRHKEAEQIESIRSQMRSNIANARNQVNRDFAIRALENFDKRYEERFKVERTSFLHLEGYDEGHKEVKQPRFRMPKIPVRGERQEMEE